VGCSLVPCQGQHSILLTSPILLAFTVHCGLLLSALLADLWGSLFPPPPSHRWLKYVKVSMSVFPLSPSVWQVPGWWAVSELPWIPPCTDRYLFGCLYPITIWHLIPSSSFCNDVVVFAMMLVSLREPTFWICTTLEISRVCRNNPCNCAHSFWAFNHQNVIWGRHYSYIRQEQIAH